MRRFLVLTILSLTFSAILPASEFDWMVREFERQSGTRQLHIPFFGLARFVVAVGHPAGASELKLAVFEHPGLRADDFSRIADTTIGAAWKPVIRVRSRDGESTNIYAQPDGKHLRLLIATLDKDDAVFVQISIRPETLMKFVDQQRHTHHA